MCTLFVKRHCIQRREHIERQKKNVEDPARNEQSMIDEEDLGQDSHLVVMMKIMDRKIGSSINIFIRLERNCGSM